MGSEWREFRLGELIESFDSLREPVKGAERVAGPYPYYGASGIVDHVDDYLFDGEYLLIAEDGENLKTRNTPIAFMATGKFWVNNHAHVVRGNNLADTRFLMYVLAKTDILGYLTGSTIPKLSQASLNAIVVRCPSIEEQRRIAHILGTLDDKIELNRQMNKTLEEMARALFKSWFVDFDPVRAKMSGRWTRTTPLPGLPTSLFDLFPDHLVDSELGEIPAGWTVQALSDVADINPPRKLHVGSEAPYVDMASLSTCGHRPASWASRRAGSGTRFTNGDTLLARITPCLENGKTGYVDFLPEGVVGWGSTEYVVIHPRAPLPSEWGYLLARHDSFRDFAIASMQGTSGRQRVPADAVRGYSVVFSCAGLCEAFGLRLRDIFRRIGTNYDQEGALAEVRDELLRRLVGESVPCM